MRISMVNTLRCGVHGMQHSLSNGMMAPTPHVYTHAAHATGTHTRAHTERERVSEREKERERGGKREDNETARDAARQQEAYAERQPQAPHQSATKRLTLGGGP